ncbi:MAG: glycine cleavage system protein GcvH [Sphingomonadaceae bacterium]|nr:glycine cleavage system protein GcvH [Sphingomonadaceae bacterium]
MTRYFTKDHEWIDVDGTSGIVGITDYAQSQLGDITYVDLPAAGSAVKKGDAPCVVDSVKAASDVYSPVSGTIAAANDALGDTPELVNTDPEQGGWLFRIDLSDAAELDGLMDKAAYDAYIAEL